MKYFPRHALIGAINLALLGIPAAHAANDAALEQRIRELESRLEKFEKAAAKEAAAKETSTSQVNPEVERLNTKVNTLERKLEVEKEVATANASTLPKIDAGPEGFRISSQDGKHQVRIRGAVQTDGRFWVNDHGGTSGPAGYTGSSGIPDSFQLKQARFWIEGKFWNSLYFKLMPDFAASDILPDAYLDYAYLSAASLSVGKQKTPLSLERLQGDSDTVFLERAYPTYLANNRDVGVMLHGEFAKPGYKAEYGGPVDFRNFISYQLGVFNGSGDSGNLDKNAPASFDDKEFDGRIWAHPFQHAGIDWLDGLGLGVAGSWSHPSQLTPVNLVSALGQTAFLNYGSLRNGATGSVLAEGVHTRIYPQAYWYYGPFGLQGEYVVSNQQLTGTYNSKLTQISQSNSAWQVQASYVLTGEDNTFQSVKPFKQFDPLAGNWGALQIAARYSELNVDTTTFKFIDPTKGARDASSWTIGLNWFLNRNALIRADYEQTNYIGGAGSVISGTSINTKYSILDRPTERVFATRFQLAF
jgi:phosphate-selective porin OprO and OprP